MNLEREREIFEPLQNQMALARLYFVKELNMYLTSDDYADDDFTISLCMEINHGWKMWLASASREGYKMVPVEPTKEISKAGILKYLDQSESRKENGVTTYSFRDIYKAMIGAVE